MAKSKIKVKEIKKKVKVVEVKKELSGEVQEESLEEIVDVESDEPVQSNSSQNISPSLVQHLDNQNQVQGNKTINSQNASTSRERESSTAVNYAFSQSTSSRRSYDSSIRAGEIAAASTVAASRIDPSISQSDGSGLRNATRARSFDMQRSDLNASITEPALRRSSEDERDYKSVRADAYLAKRRTDMM